MRRLSCFETVSIISLLAVCVASAASAQTTYTITDLGTLTGSVGYSVAYGINASGQVTGASLTTFDPVTGNGNLHAFLYSGGVMTDLGTLPGGITSQGSGINNSGQVVSYSDLAGFDPYTGAAPSHAFLYSGGTMTDLGTLPGGSFSRAQGINTSGQITGSATTSGDSAQHAFLYSGGAMHDLGTLPGSPISNPNSNGYGINDSGQVTGQSAESGNHVFLYSNGVMTDLGQVLSSNSSGLAINASGQIAGSFQCCDANHAFLYSGGTFTDLGSLGGSGVSSTGGSTNESYGEAINASGQVVGWSVGLPLATITYGQNQRAVVYSAATGMVDLNTLIPANSGWVLTDASAINDAGQIAGIGYAPNGGDCNVIACNYQHAYLLTPVIAVPTDKDQCKNNGWKTLSRADGSPFKNQGDCIQYVNTGK